MKLKKFFVMNVGRRGYKMKIEDQLVCFKWAQKMEEMGAKQNSYFYWTQYITEDGLRGRWKIMQLYTPIAGTLEIYAAYTVAELGEMLKGSISKIVGGQKANQYYLDCGKIDSEQSYYVRYVKHLTGDTYYITHGKTEANARAEMWIYLKEEELL